MESKLEALAELVASLTLEQLDLLDEVLTEWEGEGEDLLEVGSDYTEVARKCKRQEAKAEPVEQYHLVRQPYSSEVERVSVHAQAV